jgi:hypothetical protein
MATNMRGELSYGYLFSAEMVEFIKAFYLPIMAKAHTQLLLLLARYKTKLEKHLNVIFSEFQISTSKGLNQELFQVYFQFMNHFS